MDLKDRRAGIIQSCYIPWRGYFDFIDSVDLFIIFDDVEYPVGRDWRNRNQVKTRNGLKWLTVPVMSGSGGIPIDEVLIGSSPKPWQEKHRALLSEALRKAPFFNDAMDIWEEGVAGGDTHLSQLNVRLIKAMCAYLKIDTPIVMSRDYSANGTKTERLIDLLKKTGATTYLSGPAARGYIEEDLFRSNNIGLEYKTYGYQPYPQLWGEFAGAVSVLDLIANMGPESRHYLKSQAPNEIAVK